MTETVIAPAPQHVTPPLVLDLRLTDLNTVAQKVCTKLTEKLSTACAIIRCDDLPQVSANESEILWVFEQSVALILKSSPTGSKTLIHIKSSSSDDNFVSIEICSSRKLSADFEHQQTAFFEECKTVCQRNGGRFIYNSSDTRTYLFTIVLPAKQNIITLG